LILFKRAEEAVRAKGFGADAVLFVGNDMLNDIFPAKSLGFQTALFAGDARSLRLRTDDSRCRNLSADIVLTDLEQLIDHITSVNR
jgi:putative hydrolase of the HAD superfamily